MELSSNKAGFVWACGLLFCLVCLVSGSHLLLLFGFGVLFVWAIVETWASGGAS